MSILETPTSLLSRTCHEDRARALLKTLGYRLVMVFITIAVAFGYTNEITSAVNIGLITNVIKTGTYYGYERFWARITWGTDHTATGSV